MRYKIITISDTDALRASRQLEEEVNKILIKGDCSVAGLTVTTLGNNIVFSQVIISKPNIF